MLKLLETSNIVNRAIFMVRHYDGTHIGPARFTAIKEAIESSLNRAPVNSYTGLHNKIVEVMAAKGNTNVKQGYAVAAAAANMSTPTLDRYAPTDMANGTTPQDNSVMPFKAHDIKIVHLNKHKIGNQEPKLGKHKL